ETAAVIREVGFAKIHVFPYSQREGTKAAVMPGQLPRAEKERRARLLIAIGEETAAAYQQRWIGHAATVLLEEKRGSDWFGYTAEYIPVTVSDGPECHQGAIVPVTLTAITPDGMTGEII
ncbi:MAG: tRNA (N(6)-L-threonylcarbamoyladenosine(37)-C(2))-methylthiotransferase MtaB, partial [Clostridia bacterium]|nr:tRNA (N(6)-L-threonylcarbamoyladenosine(37)-C(2))-methylthiotransferase MtaB [Clostridia bacterium]